MNTVNHPDYGTLTIHERIGRSRRCTKENGTSVMMSSRALNALARPSEPAPADPERLLETVTNFLKGMDDGPVRVRTAKQLWDLAEGYLRS
jgi:hypothetical protein